MNTCGEEKSQRERSGARSRRFRPSKNSDDLYYDSARKRVYVSGGEGYLGAVIENGLVDCHCGASGILILSLCCGRNNVEMWHDGNCGGNSL